MDDREKREEKTTSAKEAQYKIELQWKAILDNIPDIAWLKDKEGRFIAVNQSFGKICGFSSEDLAGKTDLDIWPRDLAIKYRVDDEEVMRSGKRKIAEGPLAGREGKILWIETIKTPIFDDRGAVIGIAGIARDITERKKREEALRDAKEKYQTLIDNASDAILLADMQGNILEANKMARKLFGYLKEEFYKMHFAQLHPKESLEIVTAAFQEMAQNKREVLVDVPVLKKDGRLISVDITGNVIEFAGKKVMQGIFRDITERKKAEEEKERLNKELLKSNRRLRQSCLTDSHTGLYNHRYLEESIEAEFCRARRYLHSLSIVMLDIDYFKSINDVYGHQFGDLVLKQFARQLKRMVRKYDIIVRFGGEEFVIVSPGVDRSQALILAQRLLDALNLYNFGDKSHTVKLKLSLAVVSYPEDRVSGGMGLINLADQILDKAKEYGGNRVYSSLDIKKKGRYLAEITNRSADINLLKGKIEKLTKKSNESLVEAIMAFAKTIELKDHYTGEHVERTVHYATELARRLDLSREEIELIRQAAMLHDLGKIGISENILLKKYKLAKREFEEIKKHPQIGADIIRPIHFLHGLIPFIFYHHERWDGKGYPGGLKGEEIPIGARIIAMADVYQALISDRPYRKAYSKKEAKKIIKEGSGTQFDPRIVCAFLKILERENNSYKK